MPYYQSLDEFIQRGRTYSTFPRNSYVAFQGFSSLYVRIGPRYIDGKVYEPVLDLANAEAEKPGNGSFKELIAHLRLNYPDMGIYVENVHNRRLLGGLVKMGFVRVTFEDVGAPSFFLQPIEAARRG